ncbi:hypothetical protein GLAREA_07856 [Glarea lozoyensis ATCC 20868]|uniref:Ig-like domain-containing protein n=1 Tax=Glarea lozoyensis (strain ATCC 20868 / MF5171) TaxID=1116229 RepID=S3D2H5_GLAL2|nr:uncharacterized protein GLAREA_07856 [Glarea lozoyensis ATCC 20868]EPE32722.1 hypothetical protein GLAREA_07856 [Glarea lozoyensis ATCC 20868]
MQLLGPGEFKYAKTPWVITTVEKDLSNRPDFAASSHDSSMGLSGSNRVTVSWYTISIDPTLPDAFELVTSAGSDEGTIKLKLGVTPVVMPETEYEITCALATGGKLLESFTTVVIEVKEKSTM